MIDSKLWVVYMRDPGDHSFAGLAGAAAELKDAKHLAENHPWKPDATYAKTTPIPSGIPWLEYDGRHFLMRTFHRKDWGGVEGDPPIEWYTIVEYVLEYVDYDRGDELRECRGEL
tara:strand:+ start:2651 stop:2995 length:345 start_codon:yes stop_codon:yes gene_type:complete